VEISDYDIPLYNQDEEDIHFPADVTKLQTLFCEHDLVIFVSPEYNSSIPGVFKNLIDWLSRPNEELKTPVFTGKVAGMLASSPGRLGGSRVLRHLRDVLSHLGMIVLPGERAFAQIDTAIQTGELQGSDKEQLEQALMLWLLTSKKLKD
jgi:NAD(P)H-dependent FMN reductase